MVVENVTAATVNLSELLGDQVVNSLGFFIKVGIAASIAVIAYIIYLLVKGFFRARTASHISQMLRELKEINKKLDVLVGFGKKRRK